MASTTKTVEKGSRTLKNPKRELFCWLYAGYHNKELFGNGTQCYMRSYGGYREELQLEDKIAELDEQLHGLKSPSDDDRIVELSEAKRPLRQRIKQLHRTAAVEASAFLTMPDITARIDYLLESYISDNLADRELFKVIVQDDELTAKVQGIKEYNRLKKRGDQGGPIEGKFEFSWEGDGQQLKKGAKPAPTKVKATVKVGSGGDGEVEWQ